MNIAQSLTIVCIAVAALSGCNAEEKTFTLSPQTCTNDQIEKFTNKEEVRDFLHAACSNLQAEQQRQR